MKTSNSNMIVLGITGGIGSGKSYISSILKEQMNVPVYDCDTEAKRLICEDADIRHKLTLKVGAHVYQDGKLQKKVLADYLFASQQHAQEVNAIVHPAVRKDIDRWVQQQQTPVVAVESAILYESGFDSVVDKVLFVNAPAELRIQRAMQRDGSTRQQVEARINMQHTAEHFEKADYIIDNGNVEKEVLLEDLQKILKKITAQ